MTYLLIDINLIFLYLIYIFTRKFLSLNQFDQGGEIDFKALSDTGALWLKNDIPGGLLGDGEGPARSGPMPVLFNGLFDLDKIKATVLHGQVVLLGDHRLLHSC